MLLDVIVLLPASPFSSSCALPVSSCGLVKTHSRIPAYDTTAVPTMAHPFDASAQSKLFAIKVRKILATLQIIPSLQRIPILLTMAKRKSSPPVIAGLCLNVQYLFKPKLLTAPSRYAIEL